MSKELQTVFVPTTNRTAKYVIYANGKAPNSLNRMGRCELMRGRFYTEAEHQESQNKVSREEMFEFIDFANEINDGKATDIEHYKQIYQLFQEQKKEK